MKISNSKKELARIISENGGWNAKADFAAQGGDGFMSFFSGKQRPKRKSSEWMDFGESSHIGGVFLTKIQNWHQSTLSRSEYFNLYPAPDADGWIEWRGGECPVGGDALVCCKWRSGRCRLPLIAPGACHGGIMEMQQTSSPTARTSRSKRSLNSASR